tara:strand:- start:143 stop:730 length:588 start_codon:yes stop_codon:yes gene_type:complete
MFKNHSFSIIKNIFFVGFSAFFTAILFGTEASFLAPNSSASPGFFEYQWDPEPGYKRLKYYQTSSDRLDRATYYFFLRGKERKENLIKLTLKVPDYFEAKIKAEKLSLCKIKIGGYTERTRCLSKIPSLIEVNNNQSSIEIFPEKPIPLNKDNYAVVMKIFNPRKRGMFQFQALGQQAGDIPISTYLGTWTIDIQ